MWLLMKLNVGTCCYQRHFVEKKTHCRQYGHLWTQSLMFTAGTQKKPLPRWKIPREMVWSACIQWFYSNLAGYVKCGAFSTMKFLWKWMKLDHMIMIPNDSYWLICFRWLKTTRNPAISVVLQERQGRVYESRLDVSWWPNGVEPFVDQTDQIGRCFDLRFFFAIFSGPIDI